VTTVTAQEASTAVRKSRCDPARPWLPPVVSSHLGPSFSQHQRLTQKVARLFRSPQNPFRHAPY